MHDINDFTDEFGVDIDGGFFRNNGDKGIQINGSSYVTVTGAHVEENDIGINIRNAASPLDEVYNPAFFRSEHIIVDNVRAVDNATFGLQIVGASDVQIIGGDITTGNPSGTGIQINRQNAIILDDPATPQLDDFVFPVHVSERISLDGTVTRDNGNIGINVRDSDNVTISNLIAIGSGTNNLHIAENAAKVIIVDSVFLDASYDEQSGQKVPVTQRNVAFDDTSSGTDHQLQDYVSHYFAAASQGDRIPLDEPVGRFLTGDDDGVPDGDEFACVDAFYAGLISAAELIGHLFPAE